MHWLLFLAADDPSPSAAVDDIVDLQVILGTIAVFVAFLWAMKAVAFGPVLRLLDERKAAIAGGLTGIDQERAKLEQLKADYQGHLTRIEAESNQAIQAVIGETKKAVQEKLDAAREQYLADQARAQEELATEMRRARDELRGEVAALAVSVTATALQKKSDGTDLAQAERMIREAMG